MIKTLSTAPAIAPMAAPSKQAMKACVCVNRERSAALGAACCENSSARLLHLHAQPAEGDACPASLAILQVINQYFCSSA